MTYRIVLTMEAKKDLLDLDTQMQKRLLKKIIYFESLENINSVAKKLVNFPIAEYRLRVGDYRLLFDLKDKTIILTRIQHRGEVYLD